MEQVLEHDMIAMADFRKVAEHHGMVRLLCRKPKRSEVNRGNALGSSSVDRSSYVAAQKLMGE